MNFICECDHPRIEHEGGKSALHDYRIEKCNHESCTCKHYNADKKTRRIKTDIILASIAIPTIIAAICVFGFVLSYLVIDYALDSFVIESKIEIKKFENGVEIPYTTMIGNELSTPTEKLAYGMKFLVGFIIMIGGLFTGLFYCMNYVENRIKKLLDEDKK